jgi:hypothetical protein
LRINSLNGPAILHNRENTQKRPKIDQTGLLLEETSPPLMRRKYCRVIVHTSFDGELNADSESTHSTVRQYFTREKILKKYQKLIKPGVLLREDYHDGWQGSISDR